MELQPVDHALRAFWTEPWHGRIPPMPSPLDEFDDIRERRKSGGSQSRGDGRLEPAIDRMIRTWILCERRLHARERVRLPATQSGVTRRAPIESRRALGRISLFVKREQFRFAVHAVRIDSVAERVERRGDGGGRRLEQRDAAGTKPQQVSRVRVPCAACENGKRVAQRLDQPSSRAYIGAGIAIRCMQLCFGNAVEITAIKREVLTRETARRIRLPELSAKRSLERPVSAGIYPYVSVIWAEVSNRLRI